MLVWLVDSKINNKGTQWGIAKLTAQEPESRGRRRGMEDELCLLRRRTRVASVFVFDISVIT